MATDPSIPRWKPFRCTTQGLIQGYSSILVAKNGRPYSYSYSMKWYSYSKDTSETDPQNVPAAKALKHFKNGVRP